MVTCTRKGQNISRRRSSGVVPRNSLQERHSTVQGKEYVRLEYMFECIPLLKVPPLIRPNGKVKYLHQSAHR